MSYVRSIVPSCFTLAILSAACAAPTPIEATAQSASALRQTEDPTPNPPAPPLAEKEEPTIEPPSVALPNRRDCYLETVSCSAGYQCEADWCRSDATWERDSCDRDYTTAQTVWLAVCTADDETAPPGDRKTPLCARAETGLKNAVEEYNACMAAANGTLSTCLYTQKVIQADCIKDRNGDHPRL